MIEGTSKAPSEALKKNGLMVWESGLSWLRKKGMQWRSRMTDGRCNHYLRLRVQTHGSRCRLRIEVSDPEPRDDADAQQRADDAQKGKDRQQYLDQQKEGEARGKSRFGVTSVTETARNIEIERAGCENEPGRGAWTGRFRARLPSPWR